MSARFHASVASLALLAAALLGDAAAASERPGTPAGWFLGGGAPNRYSVSVVDPGPCGGGRAAVLRASEASEASYGTLMQLFDAADYRGKRIRLSAALKTEDVRGWAGLFMRVDGPSPDKPLAFDNMQSRALLGTTGCQRYEVVLDVAPEATRIAMGLLLSGTGASWIQDLKVEPVDNSIPTTDLLGTWPKSSPAPQNLAFDVLPPKAPPAQDEPTGRVGGFWFNDRLVANLLSRRPDGSFEAVGGELHSSAQGNRVHVKMKSFTGDFTIETKGGRTQITGTWGAWVKYPVEISYDARAVHMKWGFYGRELKRQDGPQTPLNCADYWTTDGGTYPYDALKLCGDVLTDHPPAPQTVITFLMSGFRRSLSLPPGFVAPAGPAPGVHPPQPPQPIPQFQH